MHLFIIFSMGSILFINGFQSNSLIRGLNSIHQYNFKTTSSFLSTYNKKSYDPTYSSLPFIETRKKKLNHRPLKKFTTILLGIIPFLRKPLANASGISGPPIKSSFSPLQGLCLWLLLSFLTGLMHSTESAITKISPWKVKQFVDEEGPDSPFATLSNNITRLLITILLFTTACSIYKTALFVATVEKLFPTASLGAITVGLTAFTLFFEELVPKALAVSNSELVARKFVPIISKVSTIIWPLTSAVTILNDLALDLIGLRTKEDQSVSEDMLRRVVDEAQRSDEGIETEEVG